MLFRGRVLDKSRDERLDGVTMTAREEISMDSTNSLREREIARACAFTWGAIAACLSLTRALRPVGYGGGCGMAWADGCLRMGHAMRRYRIPVRD